MFLSYFNNKNIISTIKMQQRLNKHDQKQVFEVSDGFVGEERSFEGVRAMKSRFSSQSADSGAKVSFHHAKKQHTSITHGISSK